MKLITPPDYADVGVGEKMIFLAGPMKGSAEIEPGIGWQFTAQAIRV